MKTLDGTVCVEIETKAELKRVDGCLVYYTKNHRSILVIKYI